MCAIFGLIDYKNHFSTRQREKILKVLSRECEVRGKDATGFAYLYRGEMSIYKRPEPASRLHLRYTPELIFEEDQSMEYGARMFDLLKKLEQKEAHHEDGK